MAYCVVLDGEISMQHVGVDVITVSGIYPCLHGEADCRPVG
jgi:hypothetical protein